MKRLSEAYGKAAKYTDYREMLDMQKDIDGVVVATPDHLHAVIALAAMDLKKHVYVQKPLTWSIDEARRLAKKAVETKVATQMGNQGHSSDDARLVNEHICAGTIGDVREVHVWTNRPLGYWPQGIPRPEAGKTPEALTEVMLLGIVSLRAGTKIHYDAANMRVTNNAAANDFLKREYRQGWTLTKPPVQGRGRHFPLPSHDYPRV